MKQLFTASLFMLLSVSGALAQKSFAIIIDDKSLQEASEEVKNYAEAIENTQKLKTIIVVDKWGVPDSIRNELYRLYTQEKTPIEGAVLIGDIPIAMIRDAQHMTSAFKMNQKYPRKESSIPSDRFYDDFDLTFDYLDKDTDAPYFYYSLKAESAQQLHPEIYTGRIRPTDSNGTSRYEKLRKYLTKVVKEKYTDNVIDQMLYFSGHGYISESMAARIDEKQGVYEHFPSLRQQQNGISYIDHSQDKNIKFRLMNELMRPELDFAILHHHGDWDTQYMNNIPKPDGPEACKQYIQSYGRAHLRNAKEKGKDVAEIQQKLMEKFKVDASWFADTFTPESTTKDSIEEDYLNLHLTDFKTYGYEPNARVVLIDACFCGSFHRENSIANEYIFSSGKTIACVANSVNVLQDKWSDRFMGLLSLGMNIGNIARFSHYLESHTIGDPTFRFTSSDKRIDIQRLLAEAKPKNWRKALKQTDYPDLQCLAMEQLFDQKLIASDELLELLRTSHSALVRAEALQLLSEVRDEHFIEGIQLACHDSYEMVERFGVRFLSKSGDIRLIPSLISLAISNNTSERTNFNLKSAFSFYPQELLEKEFEKQFAKDEVRYINKKKVGQSIKESINYNAGKWMDEVDEIINPETKEKTRMLNIRTMRNYCPHHRIADLLKYIDTCGDAQKQVMLLEALGWQRHSYMRTAIMEQAQRMADDSQLPKAVRKEALKTVNRLR